jgi:hypothetical protein
MEGERKGNAHTSRCLDGHQDSKTMDRREEEGCTDKDPKVRAPMISQDLVRTPLYSPYLHFLHHTETWEPLLPLSSACNPYYEY